MAYFKQFPYISYQFPDDKERLYKNISIRPALVEALQGSNQNLQPYYIENKDTPEIIAFDVYGDESMNWIIMLANNIMNIYTDWPMNDDALQTYLYDKYRVQVDSDGVERTLTDEQVYEFISFVGTPSNGYQSEINLHDSDDSPIVIIRPHHFIDDDNNMYTYDTINNPTDAFGRSIDGLILYPVSIEDYETSLNDDKRQIYIPSADVANKIKRQLGSIVNE